MIHASTRPGLRLSGHFRCPSPAPCKGTIAPVRVYLIRHGETDWNAETRAQGHTDVPLNGRGRAQARCLEAAFEGVRVDRILTSDLSRAYDTAAHVANVTGATVERRKSLRERCFGEFEGLIFAEMAPRYAELHAQTGLPATEVRPPGGESLRDLWERLEPTIQEVHAGEQTVAIVAHGAAISILLAQLIQGTLATSRAFRFGNCAITELERRPEGAYLMLRFDDKRHIDLEAEEVGA